MRALILPAFIMGSYVMTGVAVADPAPPVEVQYVTFALHEAPGVPESPVVYTLMAAVVEEERSGNEIGWRVTSLQIRDERTGETWKEANPALQTFDGLWWITHGSADAPAVAEFVDLPPISGVAAPGAGAQDFLEYSVEGDPYVQSTPPYEVTSSLSYMWREQSELEPRASGESEAVQVERGSGLFPE